MDRLERDQKIRLPDYVRLVILCILAPFVLCSCVSLPAAQERVRFSAERGDYALASGLLESSRKDYGPRSELLYLLEKASLLHRAGQYRRSIDAFEQARQRYEQLYTKSLTGIASSLIFTDYSMDYRGEDFERILINVFQALNYAMLGEYAEARVEAKDADSKLAVINSRYPANQKNVYREDAFCRLLMGLLYEASPDAQDEADACLWFRQASEAYDQRYFPDYAVAAPSFLKEKTGQCPAAGPRERRPAEVYVFQYQDPAPFKEEIMIPVPLPNGYVTQVAFPHYVRRPASGGSSAVFARNARGEDFSGGAAECCEDIGAIAIKNLEDRKVRTIAKAAVKAGVKLAVEMKQEDSVYKHNGPGGAALYRLLADFYNVTTNRADLRSWQTIPGKIMVTRLVLDPGEYSLRFEARDGYGNVLRRKDLGPAVLRGADKKFFLVSSPY